MAFGEERSELNSRNLHFFVKKKKLELARDQEM